MRGRSSDGGGQLAVLDAMLFFSIAGLVSSVLVLHTAGSGMSSAAPPADDACAIEPAALLPTFLRASIGEDIALEGPVSIEVRVRDTVAECLTAEVASLTLGIGIDFSPVHRVMLRALAGILPPGWTPSLAVYSDGCDVALIRIGWQEFPQGGDVYGGGCELAGPDGSPLLVSLLVGSALLAEVLGV